MVRRFIQLAVVAGALIFGGAAEAQKSFVNELLARDAVRRCGRA
jgi:hypothetical protein